MMKPGNSRSGDGETRVRYTALKQTDSQSKCDKDVVTDESPLLENIENISISSPRKYDSTSQRLSNEDINSMKNSESRSCAREATGAESSKENETGKDAVTAFGKLEDTTDDIFIEEPNRFGARSKTHLSKSMRLESKSREQNDSDKLDIVRKMSQPLSPNYIPWQRIGPYKELKLKTCQRLYAASGRADDLALFFHNGRFHAMEAWCTHMGGPLYQGDIEDYNGRSHVMCPWHSYMFDLETGNNEIGLRQKIYDLKYEAGSIWIRYHCAITTEPINRKLSQEHGQSTTEISIQKVKARKKSVLDTPLTMS